MSVIKPIIAATLAASISAPVLSATCYLRSSSGSCLFWSGSLDCEGISASGLGNVQDGNTAISCQVTSSGVALVFCQNSGGNIGIGANAFEPGEISGLSEVTPAQVSKNGSTKGLSVKATANLSNPAFVAACEQQNKNWSPIDVVPVNGNVVVEVVEKNEDGEYVGTGNKAEFHCELPNPETLSWDKKQNRPERRQYACDKVQ